MVITAVVCFITDVIKVVIGEDGVSIDFLFL